MEIEERVIVLESVITPDAVWNNIPKEQTFEQIGDNILVGISYICPISNVRKGYKIKLLNTTFYVHNMYADTINNDLQVVANKLKENFLEYYANHQIASKSASRFQS